MCLRELPRVHCGLMCARPSRFMSGYLFVSSVDLCTQLFNRT